MNQRAYRKGAIFLFLAIFAFLVAVFVGLPYLADHYGIKPTAVGDDSGEVRTPRGIRPAQ